MHVWPLTLPLKEEDAFEREALLWDLAGQEDYRIIHQLFLDETALALVLFNPQKDDPFADIGEWLKALKAAVPAKDPRREVAKLLIAARVDRGTTKVSQRKIDRILKEHGFLDYLATSAETGNNCSDTLRGTEASALKQLIARHIPWDKLPWTSTPRLLAELKSAVIEMKEEKKIRLLKFGDLVLLRPELINGYVAAVIRAARAHIDEIGCVSEDDIYGETFDFQGVDRLPRPDEELLLRAMVQTFLERSLCIADDTPAGRQLIFPSHYRRERPISSHPEIFVSYTFSGEPQTVYTTLVVRLWYSREFDQKELWGNAAEFVTSKERTLGLMMERAGEGRAKISVFFETGIPDELKVVFIEFVHQHLEKYAREANQIFRRVARDAVDGEIEFRDKDGHPSGRKIYVHLAKDRLSINERWPKMPSDVYVVIRDDQDTIRWMNITPYLKKRKEKIVFEGAKLDAAAVWRVRDEYFPAVHKRSSLGSATQ